MYNIRALKILAVGFYILAFMFAPLGVGNVMLPFYPLVLQWAFGFVAILCIGVILTVFIVGLTAVLSWCSR